LRSGRVGLAVRLWVGQQAAGWAIASSVLVFGR
jgi:hypothetical protein